jgi:DNA-binding CsgD family transcriptional regulator
MAKPREESTLLAISNRDAPTTIANAAYEAAISGEGWPGVLDDLSKSLGASAIALIDYLPKTNDGFIHQSIGLTPKLVAKYAETYAAQDVWMKRLGFSSGASVAMRGEELVPEHLLVGSDFYHEWLAPQDLFHSMSFVLMRREESHIVCVAFRSESDGRFEDNIAKNFARESAHLSRALKIHGILSRTTTERDAALATLDQIPVGVIIVDESGTVLDSNHVANEVLSSNDGLIVNRCGLKGHTREATQGLHELIAMAISPDRQLGSDVTDTILLDRPSGRPSLAVTIGRLPLASRFLGTDRRVATVYVTDPQNPFDLDSSKLRQLYKLTPAEARLAAHLAQGSRLEDAAIDLGVSLNTVRTHLKRIFSKTGTDRQAELVRLIISGPARIAMNRDS